MVEDPKNRFEPVQSLASSKSTRYSCLTFLSDASLIIAGTNEGTLAAHSPDGRGTIWAQEAVGSSNYISEVAAHPERTSVFAAAIQDYNDGQESYIRYCDIRSRSSSRSDPKKSMTRTPGDVLALAWHPDGTKLLLSHRSGRVSMHDTRRIGRTNSSSSRPPELLGERNLSWELNAMQFTADGRSILAAYGDSSGGGVRLLADDLEEVATFHAHCVPCTSITSARHDGRPLLALGCNDASVSIWDVHSMSVVRTITEPDLPVRSVRWSSNGKYLAYDATVSGTSTTTPWSAVDIAIVDSNEGIFGPLTRHRLEVVPQGRGLYMSGLAWSPGHEQMLAFCGDARDDGTSRQHKDVEPRSHLWFLKAAN